MPFYDLFIAGYKLQEKGDFNCLTNVMPKNSVEEKNLAGCQNRANK